VTRKRHSPNQGRSPRPARVGRNVNPIMRAPMMLGYGGAVRTATTLGCGTLGGPRAEASPISIAAIPSRSRKGLARGQFFLNNDCVRTVVDTTHDLGNLLASSASTS
jgi:hypothetical protein